MARRQNALLVVFSVLLAPLVLSGGVLAEQSNSAPKPASGQAQSPGKPAAEPGTKSASAGPGTHARAHIMLAPDELKWGPPPPGLPAGSQLAILDGDPSKPGVPFAVAAKMPDGYTIPPHWHPTDENVQVISGSSDNGHGEEAG